MRYAVQVIGPGAKAFLGMRGSAILGLQAWDRGRFRVKVLGRT